MKNIVSLLQALLVILIFVNQPRSFDLDSLLIHSVGGPEAVEKLRTAKCIYTEGTILLNGTPGSFIQASAPPLQSYMLLDLNSFTMEQSYDGTTAWQTDLSGQVTEVSGSELDDFLETHYIGTYSFLFDDRLAGGMEYWGRIFKYDKEYHEVAFFPLNKDTILAHFDVSTGLMTMCQNHIDELTAEVYLYDYESFDGVMMATYSRIETIGAPLTMEMRISNIVFDAGCDNIDFALKASESTSVRGPEIGQNFMVPFDYRAGHIKVQVTVNGQRRCWMILDSGASTTILDSDFADSLGLTPVGSLPAKGVGGYDEVKLLMIDSLAIGDVIIYGATIGVMDLEMLRIHGPENIRFGGVLGYDFISRFPILIDYQNRELSIFSNDQFLPPDSGLEIPFWLTNLVPTIKGKVLGVSGDMILDLGNPFGLILHKHFVQENELMHLLKDIRDHDQEIGGIGGVVTSQTAFISSFKLGDIEISSLRAILSDSDQGFAGSINTAGNIGNLILENFKVLFDYNNKRIILYKADK